MNSTTRTQTVDDRELVVRQAIRDMAPAALARLDRYAAAHQLTREQAVVQVVGLAVRAEVD
ncbi:hypothetical protein [Stutzerimonas nitrititolerans]|uniref:hypothetical protein n=1 Tax=Stutzerimonas nitrititolerans TaxID=2482751 RepID=UPI0028A9AC0A|nr:hypothetical protein [Stutzerimonas nitrititolerans]